MAMILLIEAKLVSKELKAKGPLTAKSKVRRGIYDAIVRGIRFKSLVVTEPHINSSVPQRALSIECGPEAFSLERALRDAMKHADHCIRFESGDGEKSCETRGNESFELTVKSLYTYVTLHGSLFERTTERSDGVFWILARAGT